MKRILSKSQANLFIQCPYKWKRVYVDNIRSLPSPAQERGIKIHEKIEKFYKNMKPDEDLKHFIRFELQRAKDLFKSGKKDMKYFYPLFQELKMKNEEIGLKGIVDAVYINPDDDKLIIIDWKTGKFYRNKFDDYRFELAVYAELLAHSGKVDEAPGYWGIYFVDQDKLFFEKINKDYITKMYETMKKVREGIKNGEYKPKRNIWCRYCQFKNECMKGGVKWKQDIYGQQQH